MPLARLKKDIKRHRPIDWFAIVILISVALVVISVLSSKVQQFNEDMELEIKNSQANILYIKQLRALQ